MITGYGINCEREMAHAYELAGIDSNIPVETKIVHLKDILLGKINIHDYHIINFPGGFSFGDDLGAGKGLAQRIKHASIDSGNKLMDEFQKFINDKKYILGICNGFQVMLKLGLVPAFDNKYNTQSVSLWLNDSGRFEDRWVHINVDQNMSPQFLRGINTIYLPVRHGEGKIIYEKNQDMKEKIKKHIAAQYCDPYGNILSDTSKNYPFNPDGSFDSIAALSDSSGRVLGMMPHPEAHIYFYHNPQWTRLKKNSQAPYGQGLKIFKNVVEDAYEEGFK